MIKEYELERETAKNKYLCVVGNKIEDVRKNNMIVHWIDDLDEISQTIISVFKTVNIGFIPITHSISKADLINYVCENCNYNDGNDRVEGIIQVWIERGLLYETNLGNIVMHMLW